MLPDAAGNVFAIEVLAGHNDDATFAPKPGGGKNAAMPEGENDLFPGPIDGL
jgi:hypothetical protein